MDDPKSNRHSGNGHHHNHRHGRVTESRKRLTIVLALTASYMFAEFFGGLWTGSLALLADSGHMLADVVALLLALMALWFGARPATPSKTFGYYRLEILAALINGVGLTLISFFIFYEAYFRIYTPPTIRSCPKRAATSCATSPGRRSCWRGATMASSAGSTTRAAIGARRWCGVSAARPAC